jgi:RNA polymerase sigma factor (sigma-70 family)
MSPSIRRERRSRADSAAPNDSVVALIKRVHAGCPAAARSLYEQYEAEIRAFIRHRLLLPDDPLRTDVDTDDIGQDVWAAVFKALKGDNVFADRRAFAAFLRKVARNCYRERYRSRVTTQQRSRHREQPLTPAEDNIVAKEPGPAELAASAEWWSDFLGSLSPDDKLIWLRRCQGETAAQIAQDSGIAVRTVQAIIHRLHERWKAGGGKRIVA